MKLGLEVCFSPGASHTRQLMPAHPESPPGHMHVFVSGGAEGGEPESAQKAKSLCEFSVLKFSIDPIPSKYSARMEKYQYRYFLLRKSTYLLCLGESNVS